MSGERVVTIDPPRKLPEDKIENSSALNLDLEDLPAAEQFLILTSVLSGEERNSGVHSRTYKVKIENLAELTTELYELADVQKVHPLNSDLIIKSKVRLLNRNLDSESEILVGWDYIRKALVYKLEK